MAAGPPRVMARLVGWSPPWPAVATLLALVLFGSVFTAWGRPGRGEPEGGRVTVDVGVLATTGAAPLYLGIKKGFFAEEDLAVQPHVMQSGAVVVPSVTSGELEFGFSNTTSLIVAISKGLPLRIVADANRERTDPSESITEVLVRADGPIKGPRDLEGTTISVPGLHSLPSLTVNAALEKHGVDISTIQYTEIAFPEAVPALETGSVDAIFVTEPFSTLGRQAGHRSVLKPVVETAPNFIVAGYFTTEAYIATHRAVVDRFVRAMNRSLDYAESHPGQVRAVAQTYTDISADIAAKMRLPGFSPSTDLSTLELNGELARRYGYLEDVPAIGDLFYEP